MARIAAIQMTAGKDPQTNLQTAARWIAEAADEGAELVVVPENFAYYGGNLTAAAEQERTPDGPVRSFLAEQARQHGIWLVGGTLPLFDTSQVFYESPADKPEPIKPYAASLVLNPQGEEIARYNKIHLFDVDVGESGKRYRESDDYAHGDTPVVVDTPVGKLGLSVCYDLRFPELYRQLVDQGAEIIVAPSAFTATTGEAHWQLLLRARAVENLCYIVGADLVDREHPKKPTWGGSAIIDPWGKVLAELDDQPGVIVAEVDIARVHKLRRAMPVLEHRRL